MAVILIGPKYIADSRLAHSQWETSLQSNAVSHWLGANLKCSRWLYKCFHIPGIGLRPPNERRRYKVTPSLIGWAQSALSWLYTCFHISGVLPVGDADTAPVRVDDRHHPPGGGSWHLGPRRHTYLHHTVQREVRHQDYHAGQSKNTAENGRISSYLTQCPMSDTGLILN